MDVRDVVERIFNHFATEESVEVIQDYKPNSIGRKIAKTVSGHWMILTDHGDITVLDVWHSREEAIYNCGHSCFTLVAGARRGGLSTRDAVLMREEIVFNVASKINPTWPVAALILQMIAATIWLGNSKSIEAGEFWFDGSKKDPFELKPSSEDRPSSEL